MSNDTMVSESLDTNVTAYVDRVSGEKTATRQVNLDLARRVAKGDVEAKRLMVERNMALVVSIANKQRTSRLSLAEACQVGVVGLLRAIELFDAEKGYAFSTYATWWIKQAIQRHRGEVRPIRIPAHIESQWASVFAEAKRLHDDSLIDAVPAHILAAFRPVDSLDEQTYGPHESWTRYDDIAAPEADDEPDDEPLDLSCLTHGEELVIRERYALDGPAKTLDQVAKRLGIDRHQALRIERGAITKLRADALAKRLITDTKDAA